MRIGPQRVNTLFRGQRQIESTADAGQHVFIEGAVGVCKRRWCLSEQILQVLAAANDLLLELGRADHGQVRMRAAVRTKLDSLVRPIPNLLRAHQLAALSGTVPRVRASD